MSRDDPEQLRAELRHGSGDFLAHRRLAASFAPVSMASLGVVTLYQLGILDHLPEPSWRCLAADLAAEPASSIVIAGETEPEDIRSLAAALGRTPASAPPIAAPGQLERLASDLAEGKVRQLLILGGNPVYSAPPDLRFSERMAKASFTAHLSLIFR